MALQTRMEQALLQWADKPDGVPDGHSVCHLIESYGAGFDVAGSRGNEHISVDI
jgi:hypothetical protein